MADEPQAHPDEDVPSERPEPGGGESPVDDEPLGVSEDDDPATAPLPGMPESEPPSSG